MLLDPGEDGGEIWRAVRDGLVHGTDMAAQTSAVLIGLAVCGGVYRGTSGCHALGMQTQTVA
jgi:hypothetical protein